MESFDYRKELNDEFRERKSRNLSYSLRAFARDLGVSPASLSEVLSAKRDFSKKNGASVAEHMAWTPNQCTIFFRQIGDEKSAQNWDFKSREIDQDSFQIVSDWFHWAIRYLSKTKNNSSSPTKISKTLGITVKQTKEAIHRLQRTGLLEVKDKKLHFEGKYSSIKASNVGPAALRKFHRQNLQLAQDAISKVPVEERVVGSAMMGLKKSDLDEAQKMIEAFRQKFIQRFGCDDGEGDEVYTLATQLYPMSVQARKDEK